MVACPVPDKQRLLQATPDNRSTIAPFTYASYSPREIPAAACNGHFHPTVLTGDSTKRRLVADVRSLWETHDWSE